MRLVPLPSKALIAEAQMSAHSALRNIDRGSPSEAGFVVRHFCRTYTPHPPAPGNAPVHCYTGSLFTHHYPQGISLRLSTSGQEAGYNVALTPEHQTRDGGRRDPLSRAASYHDPASVQRTVWQDTDCAKRDLYAGLGNDKEITDLRHSRARAGVRWPPSVSGMQLAR